MTQSFEEFLETLVVHPVVDPLISFKEYVPLDLSISNQALDNVDVSSALEIQLYIDSHLQKYHGKVAYGGYNETRGIYARSTYFNRDNPKTARNIHLGLDLWIDAGTSVHTPLDARVHSFSNNTNYGDYGPTIILKHNKEGITFYTLYGHLSLASIEGLEVGQIFTKGSQIASLGESHINGNYAPHLHFQIIKDMQEYYGDYPGVSNRQDLEFYLNNCPDPNLLLFK